MNFFDFFWMEGRPGIFWSVELGAGLAGGCCSGCSGTSASPSMSRWKQVEDDVPTALLLLTVGLLIAASFLPEPGGVFDHCSIPCSRLVCMGLCLFGAVRACWRTAP